MFVICFIFILLEFIFCNVGFPGGSVVKKNLSANTGAVGLIPAPGRSPGEGNGNSFQYSCLENPMDREVWWARSMMSQEWDMT